MKKIFLFTAALAFSAQAWAEYFTVGILKYTIIDEGNKYVSVSQNTRNYPSGDIIIPEKVTSPNDNIEYTVTAISDDAFANNSSITSVEIPNGVKTIGDMAFDYCSGLTSITIPASTTTISIKAFTDCSNLSSINVNENNPNYASIDGVLFNKDKTTLIFYPKGKSNEYVIPNGVTTIGESAFEGSAFAGHENMTSITIPNSVTNICNNAFYRCSSLTSITIPENVITIGDYAFGSCSSLTSVTIPASVTTIGNGAFTFCSELTSVNISEGVETIGNHAFSYCNKLSSVTIPMSVTAISNGLFSNCKKLASLTIPENVTSIGDVAFSGCSILASVNIPENVTSIGGGAFNGCSRLASIDIPASVTYIGERAFYECSSLTSVSIPANVTTINDYTFYGCNRLASAVMSEGVDSIGYFAFNGCSNLTSISLPNSVTHVGIHAFYGCNESAFTKENGLKYLGNSENEYHALVGAELDDLSSCTINSNCKIIAVKAFTNDRKMVSINIPKSVTNIGAEAFNNCSSLATINVENENAVYMSEDGVLFNKDKTILICYPGRKSGEYTIPDGVTTIEADAFEFCYNLTSVIIPASVTTIGDYAFYGCGELTTIAISEGVTTMGGYAFGYPISLDDAVIYCRVTEIPSGWDSYWNINNNYPVKLGCKIMNVAANNAQYGAVSAAGYVAKSADGSLWYENNAEATLTATAQEGYHFVKWADNNDTNATRTFNVTADATFTAIFEETENGGNQGGNENQGGNQGGENTNPPTTVAESTVNAVSIYTIDGTTIVVENATDEISVYDAMGRLICRDAMHCVSTEKRTELQVNTAGVYIVKVGNTTKRVMVN